MLGLLWELKSPVGTSKWTVDKKVKQALKQSENIIFDGRRTIINDNVLENRLRYAIKQHRSIKRLLFITKSEKILVIKWK